MIHYEAHEMIDTVSIPALETVIFRSFYKTTNNGFNFKACITKQQRYQTVTDTLSPVGAIKSGGISPRRETVTKQIYTAMLMTPFCNSST